MATDRVSTKENQESDLACNTRSSVHYLDVHQTEDLERLSLPAMPTGNKALDSLHTSLRQAKDLNLHSRHRSKSRKVNRLNPPSTVSSIVIKTEDDANVEQNELQMYEDELNKHASDVGYLKDQLTQKTKENNPQKVKKLCEILARKGYDLADEPWLGEAHDEPMLATAIANKATETAKVLVDHGGSSLICKDYSTSSSYRLTPLHLAILKQNAEIVDYMLSALDADRRRALLTCTKCQRKQRKFCMQSLSLAVEVGDLDVIDVLIAHDANLLGRDPDTGNTLLHHLAEMGVRSPKKSIEMLYGILQGDSADSWWRRNKEMASGGGGGGTLDEVLLRAKNAAGYTPMAYAVLIHSTEFAAAIVSHVDVYALPACDVDPEYNCWLDVTEIDSAVASGKERCFSVLEMYTYSMSDRVLTLGELPQINKVIDNKWQGYKKRFIAWFVLHLAVMVAFTLYTTRGTINCVFCSSARNGTVVLGATAADHVNFALELFVLVVSVIYLLFDIVDVVCVLSKYRWGRRLWGAHVKQHMLILLHHFDLNSLMIFLFGLCVPIMFILRAVGHPSARFFQAIASINGWSFLIFYIRALKHVGIFTAIVYRMVLRELANVTLLIVIVVVAFGTGFSALFESKPRQNLSILENCFRLIKVTVGLDELDVMDDAVMPWLAKLVFIAFVLFCQILLLNVLIAAMNTTYNELANTKDVIRKHVLSGTLLLMERRTPRRLRPKHGLHQKAERWYLKCDITEEDRPWARF